jgi:hypothetical protein
MWVLNWLLALEIYLYTEWQRVLNSWVLDSKGRRETENNKYKAGRFVIC